jgi:hypothetical protein
MPAAQTSRIAGPWVRVVSGALRGLRFREVDGLPVFARNDGEKLVVDALLTQRGLLLVNVPGAPEYLTSSTREPDGPPIR